MNARLVAEEGILKGLVLPFEEGEEWIIGRDPETCQILLEDPSASRKHLLCKSTPEGITLENLSDSNPVKVNDEELLSPHLLKEGDTIQIGSGLYRFLIDLESSNPLEEEQKSAGEAAQMKESFPLEERHDSLFEEEPQSSPKEDLAEINFDLSDTGRWLLKVIGGPNQGAEFTMNSGKTYFIGTDPNSCDIVFHDTSVSRQHAKLQISEDGSMFIEDLKSRNGTLIDQETLTEKRPLDTNTIVSLGTSSFVVYDREGNMQTLISPLLPSIVKVLKREESPEEPSSETNPEKPEEALPLPPPPKEKSMGSLIMIAMITGLFVLAAIGTTTLFKSEPVVVKEVVATDQALTEAIVPYPTIKYSFNKGNGRLVLFGHLLTAQDKTQLLYSLQALPFVKAVDDSGVIIDEYVWRETNQVLNKTPAWHTITLQSPTAGQFVLVGTLQSHKQAELLFDYMTRNFPYLDRLEKKVVVEEDIVNDVKNALDRDGLLNLKVSFRDGEVLIIGGIPAAKQPLLDSLIEDFKKMTGVNSVRAQVTQLAIEASMVNISDKYEVTGFSRLGSNISVVINGRIVTKGDVLDGMIIKEISPGTILLEKDAVKYRIDFSK